MLSFRKKIFLSYLSVFLVFILLLMPFVSRLVQQIASHAVERGAIAQEAAGELIKDFEMGFFGFAIFVLLLFSCMTWIVIHYLTDPIQQIIRAIKPYQKGLQKTLPDIHLANLDPNDDFSKLAHTLNNMSQKIQMHIDTLTNEKDEKETILESLVEGVIAVDNQMIITYSNLSAKKLLNFSENLEGKKFSILKQDLCQNLLFECKENQKPLTASLEIQKEGGKFFFDLIAAPYKNNTGAILVLEDKTAHYKIFEMRRDFIANASHELKTPITTILGYAETLHDHSDLPIEIQKEITTKIVRNCNHMAALIKNLLALADTENLPLSRLSHFDLLELAAHCSLKVKETFPESHIEIGHKKEKISLYADRDLLEMALTNLLENASKYSNPPARIKIIVDSNDQEIYIEISDKGIGIPEVDQEHIFDRFYTVDKARSKKMGGSGLGLAIVKTIVEKHSGSISLKSEVGRGTTFFIHLPQ